MTDAELIAAAVARTDSPATSVRSVRETFIRLMVATGGRVLVQALAGQPVYQPDVKAARDRLTTAARAYYSALARAAGAWQARQGAAQVAQSASLKAAQAKQQAAYAAANADRPGAVSFESFSDAADKADAAEQWQSLAGFAKWVTGSPLRMGGAALAALLALKVLR